MKPQHGSPEQGENLGTADQAIDKEGEHGAKGWRMALGLRVSVRPNSAWRRVRSSRHFRAQRAPAVSPAVDSLPENVTGRTSGH